MLFHSCSRSLSLSSILAYSSSHTWSLPGPYPRFLLGLHLIDILGFPVSISLFLFVFLTRLKFFDFINLLPPPKTYSTISFQLTPDDVTRQSETSSREGVKAGLHGRRKQHLEIGKTHEPVEIEKTNSEKESCFKFKRSQT